MTAQLLTPRQREILDLISVGATDAQVADQLGIGVRTVRTHLDRVRDKTGRRRRAELAALAVELRLPSDGYRRIRGSHPDSGASKQSEREVGERPAPAATDPSEALLLDALAHELRLPLTVISGSAETLLSPAGSKLSPEDREGLLARMAASADRMQSMIVNLVELRRDGSGALPVCRRRTDMRELLQRVLEDVDLAGRRVDLVIEQLEALVDPFLTERIVEHLVANAVRHTPPGTNITIAVAAARSGIELTISDDGPGIPADLRTVVFDRFRRGTRATPEGLGLYLVKRFAEVHGGQAWVDDVEAGAAVHVYLATVDRRPRPDLRDLRKPVATLAAPGEAGDPVGVVLARESSDHSKESELHHLATHDPLTGLYNRAQFFEFAERALRRLERESTQVDVLFVDIDHFKRVNESAGHRFADRVLAAVAKKLRDVVRPGDVIARIGGDEFAVLSERIGDPVEAESLAVLIRDALAVGVDVDGEQSSVSVTIGTATASITDDSVEALLDRADTAMCEARRANAVAEGNTVDEKAIVNR